MSGNGVNGPWVTQDQWMGFARWAITFGTGLAVGKGWMTTTDAASLAALLLQIAGPIGVVVSTLWTYYANSRHSILLSASQNPEVQQITVNNSKTADSIPSDKVINGTKKS